MRKFYSLLLMMSMLILGGVNVSTFAAVGDVTTNVNIDFSGSIVDGVISGTKNQMTVGTGTGAAARIEDGWFRQGDVRNVVTIPEAERAGSKDIVNVSFKMAWGNKNGMGSGVDIKDKDGEVICSLSHCRWGSSSNSLGISSIWDYSGSHYSNKPILDRNTTFEIEINYATKLITTKVSCANPVKSETFTATLTNTNPVATFETYGFNVGGNTDRADAFGALLIQTTEGNYTTPTADYTVNYKCGSLELKEADSRTGEVNSSIALISGDKNPIYLGDKKYVYSSDNSSGLTVANDNSTVVTVEFTEVPKYSYTINGIDSENNVIVALSSGTTFTDENVNLNIPLQLFSGIYDAKLYGISGENSYRSYTITSEGQIETVEYPNIVNNVVAFIEGESATGAAECTPTGNLQLASGGHMGRGNNLLVGNVSAGKYQVVFHYINTNAAAHPVTIKAGETEIQTIEATGRNNYTTDEFTIAESTDITFSVGGSSTSGVDYIYIVKTGEAAETITIGATGYATYVTPCALDFTDNAIEAYAISELTSGSAKLTKLTQVPAGEAIVVKGTTGTVPVIASAASITNWLTSSATDVTADGTQYILAQVGGKVGFAKAAAGTTIAAGKGFFVASSGIKSFSIEIEEEDVPLAIQSVSTTSSNAAYNLAGQRVAPTQKGIVIINGKKIFNK